jgi:hypothetical protein
VLASMVHFSDSRMLNITSSGISSVTHFSIVHLHMGKEGNCFRTKGH